MMPASAADQWWWPILLASGANSAGQWCWPTITIIVIVIIIIVTIIISNIIIIAVIIDVFGKCCPGSLANDARQWC